MQQATGKSLTAYTMPHHDTTVIFRRFRTKEKEVIALFPEIPEALNCCLSYQRVGQHGSASLSLVKLTDPASLEDDDVQNLLSELKAIGYKLTIRKRITSKMRELHRQK